MKNNTVSYCALILIVFLFSCSSNACPNLSASQCLTVQLDKHKGKVIYLDFWASWCAPCRKSFPWMNQVQTNFKAQGFTVISINLDTEYELAEKFLQQIPATFPVIYDPEGEIAAQYKLQGMPSSYLIGRDGKIKKTHVGFLTKNQSKYENEIKALLKP